MILLLVLLLVPVVALLQGPARRRPGLYARLLCPRGTVNNGMGWCVQNEVHPQYSFEELDGGEREVTASLV